MKQILNIYFFCFIFLLPLPIQAVDTTLNRSVGNQIALEEENFIPHELPNEIIEFGYSFGENIRNPIALLFEKNKQLNLEIIGAAGSGKCYRNLSPAIKYNNYSIILYFNANLTGCEKVRIIFDKEGLTNTAQIFEDNKWIPFVRIKNIKVKNPQIISKYHNYLIEKNHALLDKKNTDNLFDISTNLKEDKVADILLQSNETQIINSKKQISENNKTFEKSKKLNVFISKTEPDLNGFVILEIKTSTDTSSLKINGEELGGNSEGNYIIKRVARIGQETIFTIDVTDIYGNSDTKTISVFRKIVDSQSVYSRLNINKVKQQPARDAVAIIIGIEKYKRVAKADYANADAQDFYDYAMRSLGVRPENIKLLLDDGADDVEILQAFQNWLPSKVRKGKTDVYVFFSGHGYPSEDGKGLYFLPYGVDKNYIDRTAINQKEIISALQAVRPNSVTMFIDSCYSGQTRGGDTLVTGSKPIAVRQSEAAYPSEFTVFTASTLDQISWSSPDLKHGIFSYYLMKGMEGDADLNKDGKTTSAELQEYLGDMVSQQAMKMNRKQNPQFFSEPNKILFLN